MAGYGEGPRRRTLKKANRRIELPPVHRDIGKLIGIRMHAQNDDRLLRGRLELNVGTGGVVRSGATVQNDRGQEKQHGQKHSTGQVRIS